MYNTIHAAERRYQQDNINCFQHTCKTITDTHFPLSLFPPSNLTNRLMRCIESKHCLTGRIRIALDGTMDSKEFSLIINGSSKAY